jgi:5S rRNA maturation endonuclease (ribonuclease M5)
MPDDSERAKFRDIAWLMPSVDVITVLERLGVRVDKQIGDEVWGWCPDHHLFVSREPSHPKWSVNAKTGQTKCLTEDRGSNLVFIVARMRKCTPTEAADWMVGEGGMEAALVRGCDRDIAMLQAQPKGKERRTVKGLHDIAKLIETGSMTPEGYEYFMRPPGKKPTLIERATVDHFGCVFCRNGYYAQRVVVPIRMRKQLVGFVALDVLGEAEWARKHPTLDAKEYRKVLFPPGMERGKMLFGFDECQHGEQAVAIVEGAREVMKLWQLGYRALAVQGSGITREQIDLVADVYPRKIVVMMDGDEAGYAAQDKIHKELSEHFPLVVKGTTPFGHDPKTLAVEAVAKMFGKV